MAVVINDEYIALLNQAVERELQVSVQYILQHAKMEKILRKIKAENLLLDKTVYDAIAAFLKEFGIQEMKHAGTIMERIYLLGGKATTKAAKVTVGDGLKEFMKNDFKAEEEALVMYRKILEEAKKIGDIETFNDFLKIYADEEKHLFKFQELLTIDDKEPPGPQAEPTEFRKIFTADYFTLLNKGVASEISAIIQYVNSHEKANMLALRKLETTLEVITDKNKAKVVSDILSKTARQEMSHLEKIAERIYLLEGECVHVPDPLPVIGDNADQFLALAHKAEDEAIVLYRGIIAEALKRGDTATRLIFEKIVDEEEQHYWTFDDFF
ncbi:MAG: ferritin-like domain-containing protein [Candidatus Sigynarchaeota archaeon]